MATNDISTGDKDLPGTGRVYVELEGIRRAREMLLVGLASFGEIERQEYYQDTRELIGQIRPKDERVIHPTGSNGTVSDFAEALRWVSGLEWDLLHQEEPDSHPSNAAINTV